MADVLTWPVVEHARTYDLAHATDLETVTGRGRLQAVRRRLGGTTSVAAMDGLLRLRELTLEHRDDDRLRSLPGRSAAGAIELLSNIPLAWHRTASAA